MVQIFVNFLGIPVLLEKSAQDPESAHPQDLGGQAGLPGTLPLACSSSMALTSQESQECKM